MDWSWSEDQQSLRELARKILEELVTHERLKTIETSDDRIDREVWKELAKANLLGVPFAEAHGGSGMGLLELIVLLEEIGRTVAPVPVYPTLVLAGLPIARFGSEAQKQRFLPRIANGDVILSGALSEPLAELPEEPGTRARKDGAAYRLDGRKGLVPVAQLAERVLVPARAGSGVGLFLLDPRAAGVTLVRQEVSNYELQYVLELVRRPRRGGGRARGPRARQRGRPLAPPARHGGALRDGARRLRARAPDDRALHHRATPVRPPDRELPGGAPARRRLLHRRRRRSGSRCCAPSTASPRARTRTRWWRWRSSGPSEGGNRITYAAQHLHGGIGLDVDYPLHRYYLWARQLSMTLGGATRQLVRIGDGLAAGRAA